MRHALSGGQYHDVLMTWHVAQATQSCVQVKSIKASAAKGDQTTVKVLAKSLVRLRQQIAKLTASEALLRGVGTNLTVGVAHAPAHALLFFSYLWIRKLRKVVCRSRIPAG